MTESCRTVQGRISKGILEAKLGEMHRSLATNTAVCIPPSKWVITTVYQVRPSSTMGSVSSNCFIVFFSWNFISTNHPIPWIFLTALPPRSEDSFMFDASQFPRELVECAVAFHVFIFHIIGQTWQPYHRGSWLVRSNQESPVYSHIIYPLVHWPALENGLFNLIYSLFQVVYFPINKGWFSIAMSFAGGHRQMHNQTATSLVVLAWRSGCQETRMLQEDLNEPQLIMLTEGIHVECRMCIIEPCPQVYRA